MSLQAVLVSAVVGVAFTIIGALLFTGDSPLLLIALGAIGPIGGIVAVFRQRALMRRRAKFDQTDN